MPAAKTYCSVQDLERSREELVGIRHAIHENPEIGHKEFETAKLVSDKLKAWGWSVTEGVGGTGVVSTLKAGEGSRSVGIRADMDALPITEQTGLPYASRNEGLMHACGHDGHTTMLLGAAKHPCGDAQFLRHRSFHLPAGGRSRNRLRREAHARR